MEILIKTKKKKINIKVDLVKLAFVILLILSLFTNLTLKDIRVLLK